MKLKQFIFAFMAMLLCFSVSVNAQVAMVGNTEYATIDEAGTVTTELEVETLAELKDALASTTNVPIVITAQIEIPAGETVELNLNGKTVNSVFNGESTTNHIYALSNKGTLTIKDSKGNGSINSRGIYNYGSLTLNAGAINAIDGNGGYAVNNQSGSTFVMNGGVVAATNEDDHQSSSGGYDATALKVPAGCTATLNGGTINNVCDFTYAIDAAGTLNIPETSTITVNGTHGAIAVSGGVTTIDAGTFQIPADNYSRTDNVLYVSGGSLVINGGTFIGDSDTAAGGSCLYDAAGKAVVNGGTFKGSSGGDVWGTTGTTIKGGTFENLTEKKHIADGYELGADGTVKAKTVAKIGDVEYATLAAAVEDGGTITLIANETFTKNNRYNNGGWWDGLGYSGDKSFTIDLANFTISQDGALNDYLLWFKNDGAKANTITLKNGTLDAGTTAYSALATSSSNAQKITVNLENINVINNNSNGAALKIRGGSELNVKAGTIITGQNSYLGIEAVGKTTVVNIYEGAKIYMNGTSSYNGCLVGACAAGTVNVYGGYGKGVKGGFIAMTSGGTINIEGGEWIANTDGTVGNNSNLYVLTAQSNKKESGFAGPSIINVTGGTFRGGMDAWVLNNVEGEKAELNIKGGNFNADPTSYVAEDYIAVKNNGVWNVAKAAAKIGKQGYATVDAAIKAAQAGETVTILAGTYPVPAMKAGITVEGEGEVLLEGTLSGTLENLTLKNLHIKGGNAQRWAYGKGNLVFENVTFEATSVYALHFDGITAGTNLTYKNCTIIGWAAMGGSPASCVFDGCTIKGNGTYGVIRTYFDTTIKGCTFDVANVSTTDAYEDGIHAVDGAEVVVDKCTNANGDMKDIVHVHGASVVTVDGVEIKNAAKAGNKYYATFDEAFKAVNAGETLTLLADLNMSDILIINKAITFDGNGKKLTSTAARAINVSGADGVTIKNLTIDAKGERAINVIQNATNVTVDNVTATAANYTVNLASSAPKAVVAIKNSTLNGLCTVNVAAAGANVTIDNSTVNCNDNNTTAGESYAALCLNKAAVGASIVATNTTVNVTEGSDSEKGRNGAENGTVTINGSTEGVTVTVAVITYPGSDNYHGFTSLADAIEFAKTGDVVTLIRDVEASEVILLDKSVTINGEGHKVTSSATRVFRVTTSNTEVTLNDVNMVSTAVRVGTNDVRGISIDIVDNVKLTLNNCSVDFTDASANDWAYAVNVTGGNKHVVTIIGGAYEGANVINVRGANNAVTVKDATLTSTYPNSDNINHYGACIWVLQNQGSTVVAEGNTFNGNNAVAFNLGTGTELTASNNTDNTKLFITGQGTEDKPYLIKTAGQLVDFRNSVNAGETKYSAPGVYVALAADIDMAGENWIGIGSATADHGFMGNFDGQGYKIKNLTITNPALASDGYAYAGLFGVTEGTDKDNQNTIKNLTIENVTIKTTGAIAAAAIAYPYYTIIDNVKVCGDIKIQGGDYTAGVLAYTRRCVNASNLSIVGNDGSFVKGAQVVGGVISDIQMNGGLTADYKNFSADRVTVSGTKNVGGISGIIATQTLNGATVKNVTLNCSDASAGIVSGALGGTSTISNVTFENVAGATALLGVTYDGNAIEAKIGDTYYATLENALAAESNEVVELLVPYVVAKGETVTLDLNGKTVTGTPSEAKAYAVITNYGTLTISNGSVICNHTLAGSTGYAVNTITNCGTLTIEDATIENKSTAQYQIGYAIDNNSTSADAVVNIKGGKVVASGSLYYDGIRQFCNSQTKENSVVVSGGEVSTIWTQNPSDGATKNTKDVKGSIAISGGKVGVLSLEPSANFEAAVTGGHFGEISYFQTAEGRDLKGFITGGTFDNLIDETFLAMGYQLTGDAAPYTVAYTGEVTELVLVDGEVTEFVNEKEITVGTLTYKRSNIKNTWTPFYVPFAVPVSALADKFDVAYINDVRRTDSDDDGELDKFSMEIIYIHGGNANGSAKTLKANYPYFIRSKSGQEVTMEITLTDAKVYAKENIFDCTTMTEKFEIKGNYHQIPSDKLTENDYVVGGGEWHPLADGYSLNPFRFYMTKSSRYEDEPATPMQSMRIIVCGEEDENGATIIYDVVEDSLNNNGNDFIYDLQGRRVSEPKKGGIYIKNGKKILF
ncbi:MAG: right-handed parallel beta-helix repeat-containing protein [Bacteroidaceae bacterium]|nr:right-handed parallel beta-helix repeat-containing protein [Bacteroidaceae bacterium]